MRLTQKLAVLCSTEGAATNDVDDFVKECLERWSSERDPVAAFCLVCILRWYGNEVVKVKGSVLEL